MPVHSPLSIRSHMGRPMQASKWLNAPLLLDTDEMQKLILDLGDFWIFKVQGVINKDQESLSTEQFLNCYSDYIKGLKQGRFEESPYMKSVFSSVWTTSLDALYSIPVREDQQLIKIDKPVIQLQSNRLTFSKSDGKFRSMTFGPGSIHWGIQFSYPQIYQDAAYRVLSVKETPEFPNTLLFKNLQRWVRENTVPTPFLVEEQKTNVPIRLGKNCFSWINNHPHLIANHLRVEV